MSSLHALYCWPFVRSKKYDFNIFSVQCIIKQLLDSVFVYPGCQRSSRSPAARTFVRASSAGRRETSGSGS